MKCPECKNSMKWIEGLLSNGVRDMNVGRYYCADCLLWSKESESNAIREGKRIGEMLPKNISCMDKRITSQSVPVQIGILRHLQRNDSD